MFLIQTELLRGLNIWKELLLLEGSCLLCGCQQWSDTHFTWPNVSHVARWLCHPLSEQVFFTLCSRQLKVGNNGVSRAFTYTCYTLHMKLCSSRCTYFWHFSCIEIPKTHQRDTSGDFSLIKCSQ